MPVAVLTGLARLIPAEWVCFSELDLVGRHAVYYADDEGGTTTDVSGEDLDGYFRTSRQHPPCRIDQQHPDRLAVLVVSDVVSLLELRRREIYGDRFAANGTDDELSIPLPRPSGRTRVFILGRAVTGSPSVSISSPGCCSRTFRTCTASGSRPSRRPRM